MFSASNFENLNLFRASKLVFRILSISRSEMRLGDRVPIEEWSNELVYVAYLSQTTGEGTVKASVNSAH